MAFETGFWITGLQGTPAVMNRCLLGWGLKAEFPAAVATNKGMQAYATDEHILYYSDGSSWVKLATLDLADMTDNAHSSLSGIGATDHHTAAILEALLTAQGQIIYRGAAIPTALAPGNTGEFLKTQGAGANPIWVSTLTIPLEANSQPIRDIAAEAGDVLIESANTARETTNAAYVKLKEIRIGRPGTYRIKFDAERHASASPGNARIYRNGGAVGTERALTTSMTTYSEDIAGWSINDLCQLYMQADGTNLVYCQGFQIYVREADVCTVLTN